MNSYEQIKIVTEEICRTCMTKNDLISIFKFDSENGDIAKKIMACADVQVIENDGFPSTICENCIEKVNIAYDFKLRCEEIDKLLRENAMFRDEFNIEIETSQTKLKNYVQYIDLIDDIDEVEEQVNEEEICGKEKRGDISQKRTEKKKDLRRTPCSVCGKQVITRHINAHMRTHTKEKPYECKSCGHRFTLSGNLRRHEMIHTGERPHQCDECGKGFIQAATLEAHLRVHTGETPFVCGYCGKQFKQSRQCKVHVQRKHTNPQLSNRRGRRGEIHRRRKCLDNVERPFSCDICGQRYITKGALQTHQLRHGDKTFLCSECGKGFTSKVSLKLHSIAHTGEKSFLCDICNKAFAYYTSLRIHKLKHTGEKPYKCTFCEKWFRQSAHLKIHLRLHAGVKPYVCSYCGKDFAQKGNLTVHTRIHTGETPFLCPICDKGFYDSSSMKKHQRGHTTKGKKLS